MKKECVHHSKDIKSTVTAIHELQIANAIKLKPLVDAVVQGKWLEFLHNDNQWRICCNTNMQEVAMSPHRYRVQNNE